MLRILLFVGLLFFSLSCHQAESVEPEEKAAIVAVQDFTTCAGCGGWVVKVDNTSFRADLPAEFTKPDTPVWIRYRIKSEVALNWIDILTIRGR
ncbi:hypothetical protein [Spirosoma spitsbergense]|uniref:hypothetical protein n=1 Tax=Spirosoma spitsbergense TaxID=431554 RepID=UPI0003A161C1|nr:hypothetical protein [Spirosoma spitsbergense]